MKSKLDKATEVLESVKTMLESVDYFCREFKRFADMMIHVRAKLIKTNFDELEKYHWDPKYAYEDKLFLAHPAQLMKKEIKRVLDEEEDALIYN